MFTPIINQYEERKRKLSGVLSNRKDLKPENQHQIYGAINEIDLFVRTLREYQKNYDSSIRHENRHTKENSDILSSLPSPDEKFIEAPKPSLFAKIFRR